MEALLKKIESAKESHKEIFTSAKNSVSVPMQNYFPGIYPNASERGIAQGRFYEFLTAAIYGGEPSDVKFEINSDTYQGLVKPDVIDREKRTMWESKGSAIHYSFNIMNRQILGHMNIQLQRQDYQFRYALYKHPIKGMHSTYEESLDTLVKDLSEKTLFSVVLPLDVILHLSIPGKQNGSNAVRHYEGKRDYPNCICLNRTFSRGLYLDAESTIESIGLSPEDYSFERFVAPSIEINGNELNPFPIVVISRRNHERWIESFAKNERSQTELANHLKPYRKRKNGKEKIQEQTEEFSLK